MASSAKMAAAAADERIDKLCAAVAQLHQISRAPFSSPTSSARPKWSCFDVFSVGTKLLHPNTFFGATHFDYVVNVLTDSTGSVKGPIKKEIVLHSPPNSSILNFVKAINPMETISAAGNISSNESPIVSSAQADAKSTTFLLFFVLFHFCGFPVQREYSMPIHDNASSSSISAPMEHALSPAEAIYQTLTKPTSVPMSHMLPVHAEPQETTTTSTPLTELYKMVCRRCQRMAAKMNCTAAAGEVVQPAPARSVSSHATTSRATTSALVAQDEDEEDDEEGSEDEEDDEEDGEDKEDVDVRLPDEMVLSDLVGAPPPTQTTQATPPRRKQRDRADISLINVVEGTRGQQPAARFTPGTGAYRKRK